MVAFLRQFLVMSLVMLQFAAPLVHAHVHGLGATRGLHLHEFETLKPKSDTASMAALDYTADGTDSAIVELGSAINSSQDLQAPPFIFCNFIDAWLIEPGLIEVINFSPHAAVFITQPVVDQHASRAPPLQ